MTEHPAPEPGGPEANQASVTVVIPTYNRGDLLPNTLRAVFAQTLKPAEVIVVDDGSTDDTAAFLKTVEVTVIANPGGGWGPARGRDEALKNVSSEFVSFIDSDDLMLPRALQQLASALVEDPLAPFAFGRSLTAHRGDAGWVPDGLIGPGPGELADPLPALFARNFVPSVGTVVRTESARAIGGYPTSSAWAEDHYLWIQLARLGNPAFVPEITSVYRVHSGGRHDPALAGAELPQFAALAAEDSRLAPALADRLGVQLCETATPALRARDWRTLLSAARTCLGASEDKLGTVRRAIEHWRGRRHRRDEGLSAWAGDANLRSWLGGYG